MDYRPWLAPAPTNLPSCPTALFSGQHSIKVKTRNIHAEKDGKKRLTRHREPDGKSVTLATETA